MRPRLVFFAILAIMVTNLLHGKAHAVTISISCGSVGQELQACKEGAEIWAKKTGNEVKIVSTPNSATERLALYQQIFAAQSKDIDVFQIDVVWPGLLAKHLLPLGSSFTPEELEMHFPAILANNTIKGELVALPWFTDAGLLYYRKDLLEKYSKTLPSTWQELAETAKAIMDKERAAGNDKFWGFVYQGLAYEGLTCAALEWVDSFGGGAIVDPNDGKITINNPKAAEALSWAAATVNMISPQGVLTYQEEEARGVFQSGNALFMRNWPYAWALMQADGSSVKDKVGVAALPKGGTEGKQTGALGGWELGVSKYSAHPAEAIDLIRYLSSAEEQKRRALAFAFNPTIMALYQDKEILAANPFMGQLYDTFVNAVARPSKITGEKYNQVSSAFFNAVHAVLSNKQDATTALKELDRTLNRLSRNGKW